MSQVIGDDFVSRLLQGDEGEGKQAWAEFLFNIPLARSFLTHVPKDTTTACLNQGIKWGGLGWTTSRASRVVYELTGVPLVTSRVEDYRDAFLFAIAMAKEVEINVLHLSDRASEAAYQLCAILCDTQWPYEEGVTSPEGTAPEAAKAKEETEDLAGLDWDEPSEELPKELLFIWEQVTQGKRKLELRQLLEGFPKFTGLPSKAPENNFRQDCHKATDKLAKTWQQSLLHLLRLQVVLYIGVQSGADPEEVKVLQQQVFQLSCEIYTKMNNWRKEASVPGCVPTGDTVLFDKEEMSTVTQVNKVNQMTRGRGTTTTFPQVFNQKIISTLVPGFSSSIKGRGFYPYTQNPYGRGRQTSMSLENCQDGSFKLKLFSGMVPRFYKSLDGHEKEEAQPTPKVVPKAEVCYKPQEEHSFLPPYLRLRQKLQWWIQMGASKELLEVFTKGIQISPAAAKSLQSLTIFPLEKPQEEVLLADSVLSGYMDSGAVMKLPIPSGQSLTDFCCSQDIRFLVPWFIVSKKEGEGVKHRLISDCRRINQHLSCKTFRMETWNQIFPFLAPKMWACKIDLKDAFFHLSLGKELQRYVNLKVGQNIYRFLAAPFGLNILPELWTKTMKVLQVIWRKKGIMCFLYLDDILIVNRNKTTLLREVQYMVQSLKDAGLQINLKKSVLEPTQVIDHLGFQIDFIKGILTVPPPKLKSVRKDLGKILLAKQMSPRKMAAILGQVRAFLQAIPALRSFTDLMLGFIRKNQSTGWDTTCPIPEIMKEELKTIGQLLTNWPGRNLGKQDPQREIHSDSSDFCWGEGPQDRSNSNRLLEKSENTPYKYQGTFSCSPSSKDISQRRGTYNSWSRQFSSIPLPQEGGGGYHNSTST